MKSFFSRNRLGSRPPVVNASTLKNTFDRRSVMIGTVQGGVAVLLAVRMGYLAIAAGSSIETAPLSPQTARTFASI